MTTPAQPESKPAPRRQGAADVGAAILASRVLGIVREMLRAQYFGATIGIVGDAWTMAIRIPNLLQNLLGEGALSASFIPVYSRLRAEGREEDAGRLAGAIAAILGLTLAVAVALGIVFAPQIVHLIAPSYQGERFALSVLLTRILFPGAALFVFGAWCIGVLSAHRRFRLAYIAPVFWNLTMIGAFLWLGPQGMSAQRLAVSVAWASVIGAALQVLVQLPTTLRLATHLRFRLDTTAESVRTVLRNFGPVALSRGAVQVSQFIDLAIVTRLPQGAVTLLMSAQTVTMLPISLFGMAVSAAELPEMSGVVGTDSERATKLRERVVASVRRIAFFVIPSAMAFLVLGDVMIRALYQRGLFGPLDTVYTWGILAGSAFGLLATTVARLYSSAFYALHDTRTPFRIAMLRIGTSIVLGYLAAIHLTPRLGIDLRWGAAALTVAAGTAGWIEFTLLRGALRARVGDVSIPRSYALRLWGMAGAAAVAGLGAQILADRVLGGVPVTIRAWVVAACVFGVYGIVYLTLGIALRIPEVDALTRRLRRR